MEEGMLSNSSMLEQLVLKDLQRRSESFNNSDPVLPNRSTLDQLVLKDLQRRSKSFKVSSDASTTCSGPGEISDVSDEEDSDAKQLCDAEKQQDQHGIVPFLATPPGLMAPPPGVWHIPSPPHPIVASVAPLDTAFEKQSKFSHKEPVSQQISIAEAILAPGQLSCSYCKDSESWMAPSPGMWHIPSPPHPIVASVAPLDTAFETQSKFSHKEPVSQPVAIAEAILAPGELSCSYSEDSESWQVHWSVDLKKMSSTSGSIVSPGFSIDPGNGNGALKLKILLSSKAAHEKRGGMMFKKARACRVALQCKNEAAELQYGACITYSTWITGKTPCGPFVSNFLEKNSSDTEWEFSEAMTQQFKSAFVISFDLRP